MRFENNTCRMKLNLRITDTARTHRKTHNPRMLHHSYHKILLRDSDSALSRSRASKEMTATTAHHCFGATGPHGGKIVPAQKKMFSASWVGFWPIENSAPDLDWLNLRDSLETQLCTFDCLYRKFRVMKLLLKIPSKIHKNYYYKWYPHMSWGRNRGSCTGRNPLRYDILEYVYTAVGSL